MTVKGGQGAISTNAGGVVKSVARTLQTFELFDEVRCPMNVVEVSKRLGYPQSSAAALLKSMVAMGYLTYDATKRTYFPTDRVALSGSWLKPALYGNGELLKLLKLVTERSGELVLLGARIANASQLIHIASPVHPTGFKASLGETFALHHNSIGHVLMSTMPDSEVQKLIRRFNAYRSEDQQPLNATEMMATIHQARKTGYSYSPMPEDSENAGKGIFAMLLPEACTETPLAIAIAGDHDVLLARQAELVRVLRMAILHFFGDLGLMGMFRGPQFESRRLGQSRVVQALRA